MRSRAARLTLFMLFVASLGVTAYLFWMSESLARTEADGARAFDAGAREVARALLDVRNAQQAYVAAGQGEAFWSRKVSDGIARARAGLSSLREAAVSPAAQTDLDATASSLQEFVQLERKISGFARGGQNLMAADLIFADAHDLAESTLATLEQARSAEALARETASRTFERRQVFALAAAAAAALLVTLLLVSVPEPDLIAAAVPEPAAAPAAERSIAPTPALGLDLQQEGWNPPRRQPTVEAPQGAAPEPASAAEDQDPRTDEVRLDVPAPAPAEPAAAVAAADLDFSGVATLCTDLARVVDTRALPGLLDRAALLLDASGIILWIADPDGRELNPIFAQGYPPQLVTRLGTIPRDAQNATAAAFRTALVQTVKADKISDGAIAAPLVTPTGCVGVMAAEVRHDNEGRDEALAAAAIVAAQLATLVGPPSARSNGRTETAGAGL